MSDQLVSTARSLVPRYVRANRSHCFYTRDWHFHAWRQQPCSHGKQTGVSLKHRRKDSTWRHFVVKAMRYQSAERGAGTVRHFEIGWHDAANAKGDRIRRSKRYLRFKVCL